MNRAEEREALMAELAESFKPTLSQMAEYAAEYKALCDAIAVTEKRRDQLKATLKDHLKETGEPFHVEGVGTLILQPRSGSPIWDVKALAEHDHATFERLLELGCLTVVTKLADEQEKAGNVTMFRQFSHPTQQEPALIWQKER